MTFDCDLGQTCSLDVKMEFGLDLFETHPEEVSDSELNRVYDEVMSLCTRPNNGSLLTGVPRLIGPETRDACTSPTPPLAIRIRHPSCTLTSGGSSPAPSSTPPPRSPRSPRTSLEVRIDHWLEQQQHQPDVWSPLYRPSSSQSSSPPPPPGTPESGDTSRSRTPLPVPGRSFLTSPYLGSSPSDIESRSPPRAKRRRRCRRRLSMSSSSPTKSTASKASSSARSVSLLQTTPTAPSPIPSPVRDDSPRVPFYAVQFVKRHCMFEQGWFFTPSDVERACQQFGLMHYYAAIIEKLFPAHMS